MLLLAEYFQIFVTDVVSQSHCAVCHKYCMRAHTQNMSDFSLMVDVAKSSFWILFEDTNQKTISTTGA